MEAKYARALRLSLAVVDGVVVAGVVVAGLVTVVVLGVEEVNGVKELLLVPRSEELPLLPLLLDTAVETVLTAPALPNRPPTVPVLLLERVCCSPRRRTSAGPIHSNCVLRSKCAMLYISMQGRRSLCRTSAVVGRQSSNSWSARALGPVYSHIRGYNYKVLP